MGHMQNQKHDISGTDEEEGSLYFCSAKVICIAVYLHMLVVCAVKGV